ncbi:MAG: hypothetical protein FVQ85_02965 [Planctomycetes bacterium]|nr:hypothetical protein [Planctomycetota bacterium]
MALSAEKLAALLERKGIDAIVRVYPDAVFDPTTNKTIQGNAVDYDVKIIPPYKTIEGFKKAELITSGKGWTGIANKDLAFFVLPGLVLIIDGKEWTMTSRTPLSNKGGVLFYLMQIESGD